MVLQTCHTSELERSLDSLSEGWMNPHCCYSGSDRHQYDLMCLGGGSKGLKPVCPFRLFYPINFSPAVARGFFFVAAYQRQPVRSQPAGSLSRHSQTSPAISARGRILDFCEGRVNFTELATNALDM